MNKWDLDACIHCGKCTRSCLFLEKYGIDLPVLKEKPELAYHLQITAIQKRKQFFLRDVIFRLFFRKRQISWWKNSQNMMWELYMTVVGNRLKNWDLFQRQRGSLSESTGN